jgi:hypothetical protein
MGKVKGGSALTFFREVEIDVQQPQRTARKPTEEGGLSLRRWDLQGRPL